MLAHRLGLLAALGACVVAAPTRALAQDDDTAGDRPVDPDEPGEAPARPARSGDDAPLTPAMMRVLGVRQVSVRRTGAAYCPLNFEVSNENDEAVFLVPVGVRLTTTRRFGGYGAYGRRGAYGGVETPETVEVFRGHVPYIPAHGTARFTYPCVNSGSFDEGGSSTVSSRDAFALGTGLMIEMASGSQDWVPRGGHYEIPRGQDPTPGALAAPPPVTRGDERPLAEGVLDAVTVLADRVALARMIVTRAWGARAVAAQLGTDGLDADFLRQVPDASLPPLIEALAARGAPGDLVDVRLAQRACRASARVNAPRIWLAMLGSGEPGTAWPAEYLRACAPGGPAILAMAGAEGVADERLPVALEAVDDATFESIRAAVANGTRPAWNAGLLAELSRGRNEARVRAALETLRARSAPPLEIARRLTAPVASPELRATLLTELLAALAPEQREAVVLALQDDLVASESYDATLRPVVLAAADALGEPSRSALAARVRGESHLLDADRALAALHTPHEIIDFLAENRAEYTACFANAAAAVACANRLETRRGDFARAAGLSRDARQTLAALVPIEYSAATAHLARAYRPFGLDTAPIARRFCDRANEVARRAYDPDPGPWLNWLDEAGEGHACRDAITARERTYGTKRTLGALLRFLLAVVTPLALTFVVLRRKGAPLGAQIVARKPGAADVPAKSRTLHPGERLAPAVWAAKLEGALAELSAALHRAGPEAASVAAAVDTARTLAPGVLAEQVRRAAVASLETGVLGSVLVQADTLWVYVPIFPGLHDNPQAVQRYAEFAAGWDAHIDEVVARSKLARPPAASVLTLALFFKPDATRGTVAVDFRDEVTRWLPGALIASGRGQPVAGTAWPQTFEFSVADAGT